MANASNNIILSMTIFADMDASDTATCDITINGIGADTADLPGSVNGTYFSGIESCQCVIS